MAKESERNGSEGRMVDIHDRMAKVRAAKKPAENKSVHALKSRIFVLQFFNKDRENKICKEIVKKYYDSTMENQHI